MNLEQNRGFFFHLLSCLPIVWSQVSAIPFLWCGGRVSLAGDVPCIFLFLSWPHAGHQSLTSAYLSCLMCCFGSSWLWTLCSPGTILMFFWHTCTSFLRKEVPVPLLWPEPCKIISTILPHLCSHQGRRIRYLDSEICPDYHPRLSRKAGRAWHRVTLICTKLCCLWLVLLIYLSE